MPTPTYDLIEEQVLSSSAASVTFSSIPGTYKDLVLEVFGKNSGTTGDNVNATFNSDTGSNYSYTQVWGDGTSASTNRASNSTYLVAGIISYSGDTGPSSSTAHIMNYANTNVNKTVLVRRDRSAAYAVATVNLWRSTAAITSMTLTPSANSFASGCTFRLWGVSG